MHLVLKRIYKVLCKKRKWACFYFVSGMQKIVQVGLRIFVTRTENIWYITMPCWKAFNNVDHMKDLHMSPAYVTCNLLPVLLTILHYPLFPSITTLLCFSSQAENFPSAGAAPDIAIASGVQPQTKDILVFSEGLMKQAIVFIIDQMIMINMRMSINISILPMTAFLFCFVLFSTSRTLALCWSILFFVGVFLYLFNIERGKSHGTRHNAKSSLKNRLSARS